MPYKSQVERRKYGRELMRKRRAAATAAKIQALERRIADRPKWPAAELSWAAGIFEGEGTVTITGVHYSRSVVCLTSTDRAVVDFFHARWPGLLSSKQANPKHKRAWTWRLQGNYVIGFLEDILPHIRTKLRQKRIAVVLASQRARWAGYRLRGHLARIDKFKARIRRLNRRGAV